MKHLRRQGGDEQARSCNGSDAIEGASYSSTDSEGLDRSFRPVLKAHYQLDEADNHDRFGKTGIAFARRQVVAQSKWCHPYHDSDSGQGALRSSTYGNNGLGRDISCLERRHNQLDEADGQDKFGNCCCGLRTET